MRERTVIETVMPLKPISEEARREKSRKPKNISTMHIYWARRPTIAARAAILGSLLPSKPEKKKQVPPYWDLLINACTWEFAEDPKRIMSMRTLLKQVTGNDTLRMIDLFAGGGAIPLEGIRLGLDSWAVDVNPVAHLIQKGILEYPHVFGAKIIDLFEKWLTWVGKKAEQELQDAYRLPTTNKLPHAFLWAKTIPCPNTSCRVNIPLIKQYWLANKKRKKVALKPVIDHEKQSLTFDIVNDEEHFDFDPKEGTINRGTAKCWNCGTIIDNRQLKRVFQQGKVGHKLLAIVFKEKGNTWYEIPSSGALEGFELAKSRLASLQDEMLPQGLPLIPHERAPPKEALGCSTAHYGLVTWDKFFNERQLLSLITLVRLINKAQVEMAKQGYDVELRKAITLYLAFVLNRVADYNNILCTWHNKSENIGHMYTRPVLTMRWDYAEINPLNSHASSWWTFGKAILKVLEQLTSVECKPAHLILGSATRLPLKDKCFDVVVTDPPFYDNISYSDLSDFFYVWFKRTLGHLFPDILKWPLTPKTEEIIHSPRRHGNKEQSKRFYSDMLTRALKEAHRVLKDDGICVIMFTHKHTEAWISILDSIQKAGFQVKATWPLRMEMTSRMRALGSATVNSTILIVCRKKSASDKPIFYNEFVQHLTRELQPTLQYFWHEGIKGVDFFISAIGPAMTIYNQYRSILTTDGNHISLKEVLDLTSNACFRFIMEETANKNELKKIDDVTAFYLSWRIIHEQPLMEHDAANKLAKAFQLELSRLESMGIIKKDRHLVNITLMHEFQAKSLPNSLKLPEIPMILLLARLITYLRRKKERDIKETLTELKNTHPNDFHECVKLIQALLELKHVTSQEKRYLHLLLMACDMLTQKNIPENNSLSTDDPFY